jgi:hypothetical protein
VVATASPDPSKRQTRLPQPFPPRRRRPPRTERCLLHYGRLSPATCSPAWAPVIRQPRSSLLTSASSTQALAAPQSVSGSTAQRCHEPASPSRSNGRAKPFPPTGQGWGWARMLGATSSRCQDGTPRQPTTITYRRVAHRELPARAIFTSTNLAHPRRPGLRA